MKIEKNFFLLCENAIIDKENRATIVNLYDVINTQNLPAAVPQVTLVANFKLIKTKKEELKAKISVSVSIVSPSGKIIFNSPKQEREIEKNKDIQILGLFINIQGVILSEFGIYSVKLSADNNEIAQLSFEVKRKQI